MLNAIYPTQEEIPEGFRELYSEKQVGDKKHWELTGITGVKTQTDIDNVMKAKQQEVDSHKATKAELATLKSGLSAWATLKPEEITAKVDGYEALELAAKSAGNVNAEEIQKRVDAQLKIHTAPLERKIGELEKNLGGATETITGFQQKERQRTIHDAVRKARIAAKVIDTAEEDALYLAERMFDVSDDGKVTTKDGVGVTPGVEPDVWFTEMQAKRPHWWPESHGGGATGGKAGNGAASNPFSNKSWNMTEQGKIARENPTKAQQLAQLAGTTVGGPRPSA